MKKLVALFLVAISFANAKGQVAATNDSTGIFIQNKITEAFDENGLPGLLVAVINNGNSVFYTRGYANPDTKLSFDSATLFEIGSITKTFTAYLLQKILFHNNIADTTSIIQYLPDSVQQNKALQKITFLSLMNHTSGLPRLPNNMELEAGNKNPYDNYGAGKLFTYLKTCTPAPDGKSNYSNLGMGLAGVMAEMITKKKYAILLEENIFRPFNMIASTDDFSLDGNKSQGFFDDEKTGYWNMDVLAPAGGLKCTGKEMMTYLQNMAQPVNEQAGKVISELLKPTVALNPRVNVCKAWHSFEQTDKPVIYWHNGGTFGFSTFSAFIKGQKKAVMVVINKFNKNQVADGLGIAIMKLLNK